MSTIESPIKPVTNLLLGSLKTKVIADSYEGEAQEVGSVLRSRKTMDLPNPSSQRA